MNVLSLCDGMSCGRIALERAGIKVDKYYASEINPNSIKITQKNYPDTIQVGDVNLFVKSLEEKQKTKYNVNLLIGGTPCEDLSITAVDRKDISKGLEGCQSKLFYQYVKVLEIIKPDYFLFENVASMTNDNRDLISKILGVKPILINSNLLAAQDRERYYWTNISNITQPKDKGVMLKDIMETNVDEKYYYKQDYEFYGNDKKIIARLNLKTHDLCKRVYNPNFKAPTLTAVQGGYQEKKVFDNGRCRKLTPVEYERLQTVPTWEINMEVELSLDQAKNYVNAVDKSPKMQKLVGNVEKIKLKEIVNIANENTYVNNQLIKFTAQKNADMQTQKQIKKCTNQKKEKHNIIVDNVEKCVNVPNQEKEEDFALSNVFTNIIQELIIHNGKEESHQKDKNYIDQKNGKISLKIYGKEIMQLVEDVEKDLITEKDKNSIYIILNRLGIKNIEQMLIICYWYAIYVIDGFIVDKMKTKNLLLNYKIPYTEGVSDSARYSMLGDGWTVDVITHIFKHINKKEI